eukprot:UN16506
MWKTFGRNRSYSSIHHWCSSAIICMCHIVLSRDTEKFLCSHFGIACLWGVGDAIWSTVFSAVCGTWFPKRVESAFANLNFIKVWVT